MPSGPDNRNTAPLMPRGALFGDQQTHNTKTMKTQETQWATDELRRFKSQAPTAKHTPGPWVLMQTPFSDSDTGIDLKGNNGNTFIANFPTLEKIEGVAYTPSEEDAANLILIASAPELLEALECCCDFIARAHGGEGMTDEDRWALLTDARRQASEAIAKATGQA